MYKSWMFLSLLVISHCGTAYASNSTAQSPDFVIVDSWLSGYIGGFVHGKGARFKGAWKEANKRAGNDAKIWGGLFVSDTNRTTGHRIGEVVSRFVYQSPQTLGGFCVSHYYNTVTNKVNTVQYAEGATVLNMNVLWPGVALGNYILAKKVISTDPNNRMFQHEYGHYLQSKRMGWAYFVTVGLPAIMSKGVHDDHPVEVDCNREAFIYFNQYYPDFQNDTLLFDKKGWDFWYNPFPDTIGERVYYKRDTLSYINAATCDEEVLLQHLKIRPKFMDYASWLLIPAPVLVGGLHSRKYNKVAEKSISE
ncbi:MAG: hypothetical protein IT221_02920 [Fluviicola sp.]|nr:hypothetical protein [Fluviicola sp.]